jgi:hypothetical protein
MHAGVGMMLRQFLGQYLFYARPWQRVLIAIAVIAAAVLLIAAGVVTGHITMAVIGGFLLLATGSACVRVVRARAWRSSSSRSPEGKPL